MKPHRAAFYLPLGLIREAGLLGSGPIREGVLDRGALKRKGFLKGGLYKDGLSERVSIRGETAL